MLDTDTVDERISSRFAPYYKVGRQVDPNKRRADLLNEQKRRREELLNLSRDLNPASNNVEQSEHRTEIKYRNQIMLSEWLTDIPENIDDLWLMKICPKGSRTIVAACNRKTKAYGRNGRLIKTFQSILPNGNIVNVNKKNRLTLLDCIWNKNCGTFYVLDVLIWAGGELTEYDAEFRFFWLQSRMSELNENECPSEEKFEVVSHSTCDLFTIKTQLEKYPVYENNEPAVDGILFYHKEASYTAGLTPLVGWLKPYMVPELLNVIIPSEYFALRPPNYVNMKEFLENKPKTKSKKQQHPEMEVE